MSGSTESWSASGERARQGSGSTGTTDGDLDRAHRKGHHLQRIRRPDRGPQVREAERLGGIVPSHTGESLWRG